MANILVTVATTPSPLPAGASFSKINLAVTDSAGAIQNQSVTGAETPPFTSTFSNLAVGIGSVTATAVDSNGNTLGTAITQSFDTGGEVVNFPAPSAITVTAA